MSLHQLPNKRDSSAPARSPDRHAVESVAPSGFLGEVAVVAVAIIALSINMKIISRLSSGSANK